MEPINLFGFAQSTYVRTARLVCIEKAVEHALLPLAFRADSHRARHPFLKMPALEHGDVALYETLAIVTYVDGLRDAPALQPRSSKQRALMMQWISASIDYLYRDLVVALLDEARPTDLGERLDRDLTLLETALHERAFLVGDALSLADLFVAPMIAFAQQRKPDLIGASQPNLQRWFASISARPSFQSTAP